MGIVNGLGIRSFSSVKVKVLLRELHIDHHPRFFLWAQGGKYSNIYKANMHGLKSGSCRVWQRTDLQPGSSMHGLKSGSCRVWQRTDSPPGSNMLRRAAQTCSACKLAGVQIIPLPTLANQILGRTFFRSVVNLFACPAVGKFSRASSAGGRRGLQSNFAQPDRVGRRGLSEPREDFSRLHTYAIPWLY